MLINITVSVQIDHSLEMSKAIDLQLSPAIPTEWIREIARRHMVRDWNNTEQSNTLSGQIRVDTCPACTIQM